MTVDEAVLLVLQAGALAEGGDVLVLDMGVPVKIVDLATRIAHQMNQGADPEIVFTGLRDGEKLHEVMVSEDDSRSTVELDDSFVIQPQFEFERKTDWMDRGSSCPDDFCYASDNNKEWLSTDDLLAMITSLDLPSAREFAKERSADS